MLTASLLLLGLVACGPSASDVAMPRLELSSEEVFEGQRVVRLYCETCHGIGEHTEEEMLAPSLWAVRQHYIRKYPEPEALVAVMQAFLSDPQSESALMPKAVEHYGLMSLLPLDEEQLRLALRLIAAGHVERPAWARTYDKAHAECYETLRASE